MGKYVITFEENMENMDDVNKLKCLIIEIRAVSCLWYSRMKIISSKNQEKCLFKVEIFIGLQILKHF